MFECAQKSCLVEEWRHSAQQVHLDVEKNNGGRLFLAEGLFWIDFNPTDIALFDGNVPHGVTYMRPLKKSHEGQKLGYNRDRKSVV